MKGTNLSVNLNKIALLRNSRLGHRPRVPAFALAALAAGAHGVTVHPRTDARHITLDDVVALSDLPPIRAGQAELNVEGNLRDELLTLASTLHPDQYTVVPEAPGELTSTRGWRAYDDHTKLATWARQLRPRTRVAVFVDPSPKSVRLALRAEIDAVEINTGPYAHARTAEARTEALAHIAETAQFARSQQLRVHGGHDLDLNNLPPLLRKVAFDELSIGHYLTCDALDQGWTPAVRAYVDCCHDGPNALSTHSQPKTRTH